MLYMASISSSARRDYGCVNPSGTMLDRPALQGLIEATQAQGAGFISDEIYHGIEYEKKAVSALEITDECYVINSFSKYFSMTGWRVGWMVVPPNLLISTLFL